MVSLTATQIPRLYNGFGTDSAEIEYDAMSEELHITSKNVGPALVSSPGKIMGATLVVFFVRDGAHPSPGARRSQVDPGSSKKRWQDVPMSLSFLPIPAGMDAAVAYNGTAAGPHQTPMEEACSEFRADEEDSLCDLNMPLSVSFSNQSNGELALDGGCEPHHSASTSSLGREAWRSSSGHGVGAKRSTAGRNGGIPEPRKSKADRRKSRPVKRPIESEPLCADSDSFDEDSMAKRKHVEIPPGFVVKQEPAGLDDSSSMHADPSAHEMVPDEVYFNRLFPDHSQSGGSSMLEPGEDEDMAEMWSKYSLQTGALFPAHPGAAKKKASTSRKTSGRTAPVSLETYTQHVIVCPPADRQHNVVPGTDFKLKEEYLTANPITYDNANMRELFSKAIFSKRQSCKCKICNEDIVNHDSFIHHFTIHQGKGKGKSCSNKECPVCGKMFAQPRGLYKHMSVHVTKDLYACPLCTHHYSRMEKFKNHFSQNHPGREELMDDFIKLYTSVFRQCIRYENLAYRFVN